MKNTTRRAYVLFALIAVFFIGFAILAARFGIHGKEWATKENLNRNLETKIVPSLIDDCTITDRNGKVLYVGNGKNDHKWSDDVTVRKATLHVVGDAGNIGSSILKTSKEATLRPTYSYDILNGIQVTKVQEEDDLNRDIHLTIDAEVCKAAYNAMTWNVDSGQGSVGVYNYKTGEVYCMVSLPSYDPMNPSKPVNGTYLNHFLDGTYTPGSTFKTVTSLCALQNIPDAMTRTFDCIGNVHTVAGGKIKCAADESGHGAQLTLQTGLNRSCNYVFSMFAVELGKDRLTETVQQLGLLDNVSVNGIRTAKGKFDLSTATNNEIGWAGIGQYTTEINPCQMMMLMGAIANHGTAITPTLIQDSATMGQQYDGIHLSAAMADQLKTLLRSNVTDYYQSHNSAARSEGFMTMEICGKTGTAQHGPEKDRKSHAWFVGFSQREDFPVAFVVCLEDLKTGTGGGLGINIANTVLQKIWDAGIVK